MLTIVKTDWTVQVKHGKGWRQYPTPVAAVSPANAARLIRPNWGNHRHVRVRAANVAADTWQYFRFRFN